MALRPGTTGLRGSRGGVTQPGLFAIRRFRSAERSVERWTGWAGVVYACLPVRPRPGRQDVRGWKGSLTSHFRLPPSHFRLPPSHPSSCLARASFPLPNSEFRPRPRYTRYGASLRSASEFRIPNSTHSPCPKEYARSPLIS